VSSVDGTALRAVRLHPLEVCYGLALGVSRSVRPLEPDPATSPREAFERVMLRALRRPPCVVSFSGGLDSSGLLALAAHVARREGLPPPIAATLVFPEAAASDEREWQELVLRHVGVSDWVRLPFSDELDAVGPVAQRAMLRHGLLWPFNLHFHLPIVEAARGGTLVTGFGGDELGRSSVTLNAERAVARRRISGPRELLHIGYRLSPAAVRHSRELFRRLELRETFPYLTAKARAQLRLALTEEHTHPFGWSRLLRGYMWRARYFRICRENFRVMGAHEDVVTVHPFVEAEVLRALGEGGRYAGMGSRKDILTAIVGDLLPPELLARTTKAVFSLPLWTETATDFARGWSGSGLDASLVDPEAVRATWLTPGRSVMTTSMLQAAWLADQARAG
jgi:asparagine synthase (glutamine-hydrolysing)